MARPQEFDTGKVLHQAMSVFWDKGYEATSLFDLLEATGLSRSSLYASFGGKRDLFAAAFDSYRADRVREMNLILGSGPGRDAIEAFFHKIISDATSPYFAKGCMSTNQAIELAPHDPEIRSRVEEDFQLIEDALATAIARGKQDGSIRNKRDTRDLARLLVVAFPGFQVMVRAGGDKSRLEDALRMFLSNLD